ncbi:MAG: hypothetical protein OEY67_00805 [Gammaproteobacteria bacterium]|nr:hypothetical protein [Gammaproteobacteria bacterium]
MRHLRFLIILLPALVLLVSCNKDTFSVFFDIPETDPNPTATSAAKPAPTTPAPAAAQTSPNSRELPPAIENAAAWEVAERMLPKNKLGQHDWMEAVRQSVIKPKSAIGGPRTPNFVFKFDFYLPGPTPMFDALFPHSSHTQWLDCSSCHPKIFRYRGTKITMQDIRERKYCGVCHGPVAFPADADNCGRCHTAMMPPE